MGIGLQTHFQRKYPKYESAVYFALLLFRSVRISLFGSVSAGHGTLQSLSPNEPPFVASVFRICRRIQWQMWQDWNVGVAFSTSIAASELGKIFIRHLGL